MINEYAVPTASPVTQGITTGCDGNVWFTEFVGNRVGQVVPATGVVTEFGGITGPDPHGITPGPDGNLWIAETGANLIAAFSPGDCGHTRGPASLADAKVVPNGVNFGSTARRDDELAPRTAHERLVVADVDRPPHRRGAVRDRRRRLVWRHDRGRGGLHHRADLHAGGGGSGERERDGVALGRSDQRLARRPGPLVVAPSGSPGTSRRHREDRAVDGVHDLGGMHGFGPVPIEADEPLFHEAVGGAGVADGSAP